MDFHNNFSYEGVPVYRPTSTYDVMPSAWPQYSYADPLYRQRLLRGLGWLANLMRRGVQTTWFREIFEPLIEKTVTAIAGSAVGKAARRAVVANAGRLVAELDRLAGIQGIILQEIVIAFEALFIGLNLPQNVSGPLAQGLGTIILAMSF